MASTTAPTTTLGMHIDGLISRADALSSTELYAVIVAVTVIISFVLLGTHQPASGELVAEAARASSVPAKKSSAGAGTGTLSAPSTGPEPRWHIFKAVNWVAMAAFITSVVQFGWNATTYLHSADSTVLFRFLLGWSLFLCYFFGFFGVSFVHELDQGASATGSASASASASAASTSTASTTSSSASASTSDAISKEHTPIHPPAFSTPVCSHVTKDVTAAAATNIKVTKTDIVNLDDAAIADLVLSNQLKDHELEKLTTGSRAVAVRRIIVQSKLASLGIQNALENLPSQPSLDYDRVHGANCEIVVGYVPLPVGLVGPLTVNGETVYVPMATTEGCLVASTNRGAKAITAGGGATAVVLKDGITRAPCIRMQSAAQAAALAIWCQAPANFAILKQAFESTTSFGKLQKAQPTVAGKNVYLRLTCFSGDAMGMNMVSKGSLAVIGVLQKKFPDMVLVALSGNMCTDKKAAATNWLEGRGKSVVVEATIPAQVVRSTLKTTVKSLVDTNLHKNLIGSAMAGTIGGFNAHASNIVTAVFLATGQDPAQNVESSNCITLLEETDAGDLWISCTMPSLEVGTVGGGTSLPAQHSCLAAMGCQGGGVTPGKNAQKLATIVASATMAGELSLLAALAANTLVQAHMQHNRKPAAATTSK